YKFESDNLELVTVIECVCADGTKLQPAFVFAGKEQCPSWWTVDPRICTYSTLNGWMDDFVGSMWFEKSFIPQATAHNPGGKPILL
ncbi:hypothetical protein PAXRUDRAFT_81286, partial [Paxillus rubicundulus Ve08.2h10]